PVGDGVELARLVRVGHEEGDGVAARDQLEAGVDDESLAAADAETGAEKRDAHRAVTLHGLRCERDLRASGLSATVAPSVALGLPALRPGRLAGGGRARN